MKGTFKRLTEQYVCQQYLNVYSDAPFYFTNDNSTMILDFVTQNESICAIEVKAEENVKSKSLSNMLNNNASVKGIRFSMAGYIEQERITNYHLSMAEEYFKTV